MKSLITANTMISVSHSQNKDIFNALKIENTLKVRFSYLTFRVFSYSQIGKEIKTSPLYFYLKNLIAFQLKDSVILLFVKLLSYFQLSIALCH